MTPEVKIGKTKKEKEVLRRIDWGKVLTSKTLWLNAIACIIVIIQALSGEAWFNPELQVLILGILNALIRFLTQDSLITKT